MPSRFQLEASSQDPRRGGALDIANVLALLALPPPIHGQSVVNAMIAARFVTADLMRTHIVDIGPGRLLRGPLYHLTRIVRIASALVQELKHVRFRNRTLYTVVDSGWGIFYNYITVGLARALHFRIIVHHHTAAHTLARRPAFSRLARIMGRTGIHVALGPAMAADLRCRYPSIGRVIVLNNAFAVEDCRGSRGPTASPSRLCAGFLSNLSDAKGLKIVIDVLRDARRSGLDVVMHLAGPIMTAEADARIEIARREFGGALKVLGPVSGQAKKDFFDQIDVFLFPTNYKFEAQPLVIIEAMAHGCAIIVNARGYIAELVGEAATVVENDAEFAAIALKLCGAWSKDPARLQLCRELAQERFKELRKASDKDLDRLVEIVAQAEVR